MRHVKGKCVAGRKGISYRSIIGLTKRPAKCQCVWARINLGQEICGCPPDKEKQKCRHDGQMMIKSTIKYHVSPQRCTAVFQKAEISPCAGQTQLFWVKFGSCDRLTCLKTRVIFKRVSEACKCVVKSLSVTEAKGDKRRLSCHFTGVGTSRKFATTVGFTLSDGMTQTIVLKKSVGANMQPSNV
ncbi:unnamed protein product [Protopolystoma xenopodis]|uniref:Uncharacterized protein n=1 Tax=Protopolystoma xenopodis TaxID=117903 RepID=A0A3S5AEX9_9PLAT|nr:unnamed protein product [Protopolystoma xenopodis]